MFLLKNTGYFIVDTYQWVTPIAHTSRPFRVLHFTFCIFNVLQPQTSLSLQIDG